MATVESGGHPHESCCRLILEGVLHLLAYIFQAGFRLVDLAFILSALVIGELADAIFGLAAHVIDFVTDFPSGTDVMVLLSFPAPCGASLRYRTYPTVRTVKLPCQLSRSATPVWWLTAGSIPVPATTDGPTNRAEYQKHDADYENDPADRGDDGRDGQ